jgi:hypothetical protein
LRYRQFIMILLSASLLMGLVLLQGCNKAEAQNGEEQQAASGAAAASAGSDDPEQFFIGLEDRLSENALASIAIIEIVDPKENDRHKIRNVHQATMEQLSLMVDVAIREVSEMRAAQVLGELKGTAAMGLDPESVMDIGIKLNVDVVLFASIESKQNDVFFKAYSTMSGDVIFSDTLRKWQLPVGDPVDSLFDFGIESEVEETTSD